MADNHNYTTSLEQCNHERHICPHTKTQSFSESKEILLNSFIRCTDFFWLLYSHKNISVELLTSSTLEPSKTSILLNNAYDAAISTYSKYDNDLDNVESASHEYLSSIPALKAYNQCTTDDLCWCCAIGGIEGLLPLIIAPPHWYTLDLHKACEYPTAYWVVNTNVKSAILPSTDSEPASANTSNTTHPCVVRFTFEAIDVTLCNTREDFINVWESSQKLDPKLTVTMKALSKQGIYFEKAIEECTLKNFNNILHPHTSLTSLAPKDFMNVCNMLLFYLWGPADSMNIVEILRCTQWRLYNSALKCLLGPMELVVLPPEFLSWLEEDGIFLEDTSDNNLVEKDKRENPENCTINLYMSKQLCDLRSIIDDSITKIGSKSTTAGWVFPKLDWSSPKDADWMAPTGNSIACSSARDVMLLFKSSAWITHDIDKAFSKVPFIHCDQTSKILPEHYLCLKPWNDNLLDENEFRIFFWNNNILGVSQRNVTTSFKHLTDDTENKKKICKAITSYFDSQFFPAYKDLAMQDDDYNPKKLLIAAPLRGALDISILKTKTRLTCELLDVSPWGGTTDPLLFDWNELRDKALCLYNYAYTRPPLVAKNDFPFEFRIVKKEMDGKRANPERYQRFPEEFLNFFDRSELEIKDIKDLVSKFEESEINP